MAPETSETKAVRWICMVNNEHNNEPIRDDIKSSGKFVILTKLKIEGEGVKGTLWKKIPLKIQTFEDSC